MRRAQNKRRFFVTSKSIFKIEEVLLASSTVGNKVLLKEQKKRRTSKIKLKIETSFAPQLPILSRRVR